MDHSLHNCQIHGYETIYARLKDGRIVELEVNDDGELLILGETLEGFSVRSQIVPSGPQGLGPIVAPPQAQLPPPEGWHTIPTLPPDPAIPDKATPLNAQDSRTQQAAQAMAEALSNSLPRPYQPSPLNQAMLEALEQLQQPPHPGVGIGAGSGELEAAVVDDQTWHAPFDQAFKSRLMSVLNDNKFDRRLKGRTRGKLDLARLHKAPTGASSLFTLKQSRRGKRYHVALVVDESGSMAGTRIHRAGEIAQFLAKHFQQIPGVDLAVIGFDSSVRVHKNFNSDKDIAKLKYSIIHSGGGGTGDYAALTKTYKMLAGHEKAEPGQNLVLFLTDGDSDHGEDATSTLIRRNQEVAVTVGLGIGIEARQVPPGMRVRVDNVNTMKPQIIEILHRQIRRG